MRRFAARRSGLASGLALAVSGDRYSIGYSVTRAHVACDSRSVTPLRWRWLLRPEPSRGADCQRFSMLDLERPSVSIRWRPPLSVAIVTHLVTQLVTASRPNGVALSAHVRISDVSD